jgi:hypothetical protein
LRNFIDAFCFQVDHIQQVVERELNKKQFSTSRVCSELGWLFVDALQSEVHFQHAMNIIFRKHKSLKVQESTSERQ